MLDSFVPLEGPTAIDATRADGSNLIRHIVIGLVGALAGVTCAPFGVACGLLATVLPLAVLVCIDDIRRRRIDLRDLGMLFVLATIIATYAGGLRDGGAFLLTATCTTAVGWLGARRALELRRLGIGDVVVFALCVALLVAVSADSRALIGVAIAATAIMVGRIAWRTLTAQSRTSLPLAADLLCATLIVLLFLAAQHA
ncbi:MAG: hypothetical protein ACHREM_28225 [Polyangiales bacterium]